MTNHPLAVAAYDELAEAYAALIDRKPHNAYYERPATLSLLPDVSDLRVFDAGCGPGIYSEWLVDHGAEVVAVDASPKMVELARERLHGRAEIHVADIGQPLTHLKSESFDLIVCTLVLEYVEDWRATASEFNRILRPGGHLVVSVTHPHFDFTYFESEAYFETELVSAEWKGFHPVRIHMPSFRRSLEETLNPFLESGFYLERILEPKPTEAFRKADRRHYDELMKQPCFLCIRACKGGAI